MAMSMTLASILTGVFVAALGASIAAMRGEKARERFLALLRNRIADGVLLALAAAWFLWIVLHLGDADFGDFKALLFALFLGTAVGSYFFVKDFLGVRAMCVLYMLGTWKCLGAAFGHYDTPGRLFMVGTLYVGLLFALYLGAAPYRARDLMEWFTRHARVSAALGAATLVWGLWLCLVPAILY